jgi:hypothetical protein
MVGLMCVEFVLVAIFIAFESSFVIRHIRGSYSAKRTYRDVAAGIVLGFVVGALSLIMGGFSPVLDVLASCIFGFVVTVIASFDLTP